MFSRIPAAAVLTGAAGLIHAAAAVTHVGETLLLGLAFTAVAWAQVLSAVWLAAGRGRAALAVMSGANVAALAGWGMSRTVGLPYLHPAVEPVGIADALTVGLEVLALVAALALLRRHESGRAAPRALPLGVAAAGVIALGASGVAVADLGSTSGHGHGEEAATAAEETHGHSDGEDADGHGSTSQPSRAGASRQPGTLPAALHRHRAGIYHLHEDIRLHRHDGGIIHVHTKPADSASPSSSPSTGGGDHHDGGSDDHAH